MTPTIEASAPRRGPVLSVGRAPANPEMQRTLERPATMPHRNLRDDDGRDWEVWDVIPSTVAQNLDDERARQPDVGRRGAAQFKLPVELRNGWLAFQCGRESRRLAPIPARWIDLSDAELRQLIVLAATTVRTPAKPDAAD